MNSYLFYFTNIQKGFKMENFYLEKKINKFALLVFKYYYAI